MRLEHLKENVARVSQLTLAQVQADTGLQALVLNTYWHLFDQDPCGGCQDKMKEYLSRIKTDGMTTASNKAAISTQFVLRDPLGHSMEFGSRDRLVPANLTDARAIQFLRGNPNRIKLFKKFPANWRDMLTASDADLVKAKTAKEIVAHVATVDDIQILEELKTGETRVTVIKAIDDRIAELGEPEPEAEQPQEAHTSDLSDSGASDDVDAS